MNIALIHDWLINRGGAERVLLRFHSLWPDAPIYTLTTAPSFRKQWLPNATVRQAWPGKVPWLRSRPQLLAPLLPSAIESFDLSAFDLVLSSSVIFAKGVVTRTRTRHICYCYSPSRMLWDRHAEYERQGIASRLYRHGLRLWDFQAAQRPDTMIAISNEVQGRIHAYYRRSSTVIHPPIQTLPVTTTSDDGSYLVVGRLMPHKRLDMVINAFSKLGYPLVIVGAGPLEKRLRRYATTNIRFAGAVDDRQLSELYARCHALIVPNDEDFGMTAVEAMAYGKPVLAFRGGGVLDVMKEGETGEFFEEPIPEALAEGVLRMRRGVYDPDMIQKAADPFSAERFDRRIRDIVTT